MLNDERIRRRLPPYVAYRTFKTFIESLGESVPSRVDRNFAGMSFSGTTSYQLMAALIFLGLIDNEGTPTHRLKLLIGAKDVKKTDMLKQTCMDAFSFLFKGPFDPQTATPQQLQKAFNSSFKISGDVNRKCVKFFVDMANDAGIQISPFITSKKLSSKIAKNSSAIQTLDDPPAKVSLDMKLLDKFPSFDPTWPDEVKISWFKAFEELRRGLSKLPSDSD
jgi:hypothetical protein